MHGRAHEDAAAHTTILAEPGPGERPGSAKTPEHTPNFPLRGVAGEDNGRREAPPPGARP